MASTARYSNRPGADTRLLEAKGAVVCRGDLGDPASLPAALEGADVVFHTAAKVGDWGPPEEYRAVNVEGLRHLVEACRGRPLRRFVHFSSLGVYAARHHHGTSRPRQHGRESLAVVLLGQAEGLTGIPRHQQHAGEAGDDHAQVVDGHTVGEHRR